MQRALLVLALLITTSLLAGSRCGPGSGDDDTPTPTEHPSPTAEATPTASPTPQPTPTPVPTPTACPATLDLGQEGCSEDCQCTTGACWDFSDYDPWCFGSMCTAPCETDQECQDAFRDAGASSPHIATCGPDGRCAPVGTGLGAWACARTP